MRLDEMRVETRGRLRHHAGCLLHDARKEMNADGEIRRPEERASFRAGIRLDRRPGILPPGRPAHHGAPGIDAAADVRRRGLRYGELDGHIGPAEQRFRDSMRQYVRFS
jgi:hypothetical protein